MTANKLNTIYIISKGRPNCTTAATLTNMGYTGEWFIVCGNNDETIPQYQANWGNDRVLIFDWYEQVKESDLLDNFGVENMSSGAVPVRNATRVISEQRGETRHWQFDDDYTSFYRINDDGRTWSALTGDRFEAELSKLASYADSADLCNIGFCVAADTRPRVIKMFARRVFNAHNLPTDKSKFIEWRGRMNDDLINALTAYHTGRVELSLQYMSIMMSPSQVEAGGNTDIYQLSGTVRKTAYAVMIEPKFTKLVIKHGRYHHKVSWRDIVPKILDEKFKKKTPEQQNQEAYLTQ